MRRSKTAILIIAKARLMTELILAKNAETETALQLDKANRHGLITGATGTGKTVTLQALAQQFSAAGVPVFMADVKGDLTGISQPGAPSDKLKAVLAERGIALPTPQGCPTTLWDVFGEQGHPVRATISDMGPLLLSRMLDLNEVQSGVLQLVFKIADDRGLLLLDMKDLRAMCQAVADNAREFTVSYGNISAASIGAIQRALLRIEEQGGNQFFGEPMLDIDDMMQTVDGHGVINILAAEKLMNSPRLYATFLLWMLSDLYERLPEVGDLPKPKFVFFFDEAHLLFKDAPKVLIERIELVVRLSRSKGVGVYFVSQNPLDVPDTVLGQLGNRVQHALRAFTPRDQKAVKTAASTMRPKAGLNVEQAISELAVGEALVSFLDPKGTPAETERVFVMPPASYIGPVSDAERRQLMRESLVAGIYDSAEDRESAYEILQARASGDPKGGAYKGALAEGLEPSVAAAQAAAQAQAQASAVAPAPASTAPAAAGKNAPAANTGGGIMGTVQEALFGSTGPRGGQKDGLVQQVVKGEMRRLGREMLRGALGSLIGGKKR